MLLAKIKRVKLEIYEFYLYLRRVTCSKFLIPEESYMYSSKFLIPEESYM